MSQVGSNALNLYVVAPARFEFDDDDSTHLTDVNLQAHTDLDLATKYAIKRRIQGTKTYVVYKLEPVFTAEYK